MYSGCNCLTHAAKPAIIGEEKEVPDARVKLPLLPATKLFTPMATTLGFMRPSAVGPNELKLAMTSKLFTAPTDKMLSASAGVMSIFHSLSAPSLPMELHTKMPLRAAVFAALATIEVLPSMCLSI